MAVEIIVSNKSVNAVLDLVYELRDTGLVSGKDFDFAYSPSNYGVDGSYTPQGVKFTFYDNEQGMIYSLKWS